MHQDCNASVLVSIKYFKYNDCIIHHRTENKIWKEEQGPAKKSQRKVKAAKNEAVKKRKAVEEVHSYTITVLVHCSSHFTTVDI